jgi:hypothetical protein
MPRITAQGLKRFNLIMTVVWILLAIPTVTTWRDSLLWIAFMSVWNNVFTHFSAWVSSRAEVASNGEK